MCTDCLQHAYTCVRWLAYGMFYIHFRCFARQSSTITSMLIFQYDKYCLRYGLLASRPKLGLVDCNSRWAGDVVAVPLFRQTVISQCLICIGASDNR